MKGVETIALVFLILVAVLTLNFLVVNCQNKTCSAGKTPKLVDYACICVEVPK